MFSLSLEEVIEKARESGACEKDLNIIKSLDSIENVASYEKAAYWLYWYARDVIQGRWYEAEKFIRTNLDWWDYYSEYFGIN